VWHHWGVTVDLVAGTHDEFTITNGATFVTTHYVPAAPLLLPIAPALGAPLPTDFRVFGGGGLGNVFAVDNLTITYGAQYTTFGAGCPGALGVPTLAAAPGSLPILGTTFTATVGNLPVSVGLMITGLSNTLASGSIPLPFPLAGLGWPGCDLLVDPLLTDTIVGVGNSANWSLAIPPSNVLLNFPLLQPGREPRHGADVPDLQQRRRRATSASDRRRGGQRFFFLLRRFCGSETEPSGVDSGCFIVISSSAFWLRSAVSASLRGTRSLWPLGSTPARLDVVVERHAEHFVDHALLELGIEDRRRDLDAAVEVARHPVGGRQVDERVARVLEVVDAAVLEEAVDDRLDGDVLREAGHTGAQTADAAHAQLHLHAAREAS
jgi:hypothetical protein